MRRTLVVLAIAGLGLAVGGFSLSVARGDPGYSFAGESALGAIALLGAGWALIGCGLVLRWRQRGLFGPLLVAAGFAWFIAEWDNPGNGSALAFTIGLCLYTACAPVVAHAVLAYPHGRLRTFREQAAVAASYVGGILVLGVLPALFVEPRAEGCGECPRNLVLVADRPDLADELTRVGLYLGVGWSVTLATLAAVRAVRETAGTRPILAGGVLYLSCVAATFAVSLDRGLIATGTLERRLWLSEAAALVAVALATGWSWARGRRARAAVARLVVELAQSPSPGGLRDVLARIVGDPDLVLAYPVEAGRLVDAFGRPAEPTPGQERTSLVRDRLEVAVLGHAPGLLDEQHVEDVTAAARLALENERLQAEARASLEQLRASRTRIVAAGDAERKRLERDLHDGAQQRLVALSLSLRLARLKAPQADVLERAERELGSAIEELRALAHGIFPAVLADDGLSPAVYALAEEARTPLSIGDLPERRFNQSLESAAYAVIAEAVRTSTGRVSVSAHETDGVLAVELAVPGVNGLDVLALEDRLGALDGRLDVVRADEITTIHAELPCGS
jgi:signal transduction histidine kinase